MFDDDRPMEDVKSKTLDVRFPNRSNRRQDEDAFRLHQHTKIIQDAHRFWQSYEPGLSASVRYAETRGKNAANGQTCGDRSWARHGCHGSRRPSDDRPLSCSQGLPTRSTMGTTTGSPPGRSHKTLFSRAPGSSSRRARNPYQIAMVVATT